MIKPLLTASAVIEGGTGAGLVLAPSLCVQLLLASRLEGPAAEVVCRVAGVVLLSLGVACWLSRLDRPGRAARGVVAAMLLYNVGVAALLADSGAILNLSGVLLWPAVILHAGCAAWCIATLAAARRAGEP
jgi:hypothetical protein